MKISIHAQLTFEDVPKCFEPSRRQNRRRSLAGRIIGRLLHRCRPKRILEQCEPGELIRYTQFLS